MLWIKAANTSTYDVFAKNSVLAQISFAKVVAQVLRNLNRLCENRLVSLQKKQPALLEIFKYLP